MTRHQNTADSAPKGRPYGFDILRIVAASMVVWGHSELLTWQPGVQFAYSDRNVALGTFGVIVFFAASGYLITGSWQRVPEVKHFALHRFFRIWPGLALSVLIVAFVVGPIWTTHDSYLQQPGTWSYVVGNLAVIPYEPSLPGVFDAARVPEVSGTLWSLGVEVTCYALVVIAGLVGVLQRARWLLVVGALALGAMGWTALVGGVLPDAVIGRALPASAFVFAMIIRSYRISVTGSWAAVATVVTLGLAVAHTPLSIVIAPLAAYVTIYVGTRPMRWAGGIVKLGDPSYGSYIYGFPLQQILLAEIPQLNSHYVAYAVISVMLSLVAGYISWHVLEKHALAVGRKLAATRNDKVRGRQRA